jgi:3-phenylpropionate/cinnamic acid dioxygenase small subunit
MSVSKEQLIDFIYDEVRMLDEGRDDDEWLALWLKDGHYWMPLDYKQTDPHNVTSLMYEDLFMFKLRVERLNGARTFSQKPKSRCHHVIQRPFVDAKWTTPAGTYRDHDFHALCRDAARRAIPVGADSAT